MSDNNEMTGTVLDLLQVDSRQIFICDDIERQTVAYALRRFTELGAESPDPIHIYLNSDGGCVDSAMALIDMIEKSKCDVYTYVVGFAASAAAWIAIAGDRRHITKHSGLMFHATSWGAESSIREVEQSRLDYWAKQDNATNIWAAKKFHTSPTKYKALILNGLWLTAREAVKMKVMDKIM